MAKNSGIDLSKLSLEELESLAKDIETEVTTRRQAERERIFGQMRELAASLGLTLEEIGRLERGKGGAVGAGAAQPKYRSPDDPNLTWSGRGKRPAWVNEALAAGKSLEDLAL